MASNFNRIRNVAGLVVVPIQYIVVDNHILPVGKRKAECVRPGVECVGVVIVGNFQAAWIRTRSKKFDCDAMYSREGVVVKMATCTIVSAAAAIGNVDALIHGVEDIVGDRQVMEGIERNSSSTCRVLVLRIAALPYVLECIV